MEGYKSTCLYVVIVTTCYCASPIRDVSRHRYASRCESNQIGRRRIIGRWNSVAHYSSARVIGSDNRRGSDRCKWWEGCHTIVVIQPQVRAVGIKRLPFDILQPFVLVHIAMSNKLDLGLTWDWCQMGT
jgi:hypothetical protein